MQVSSAVLNRTGCCSRFFGFRLRDRDIPAQTRGGLVSRRSLGRFSSQSSTMPLPLPKALILDHSYIRISFVFRLTSNASAAFYKQHPMLRSKTAEPALRRMAMNRFAVRMDTVGREASAGRVLGQVDAKAFGFEPV
jgi:hypothetical protein